MFRPDSATLPGDVETRCPRIWGQWPRSGEKADVLTARGVAVWASRPIWVEEEMSGFNTEFILHLPKSSL